MKAAPFDYIRAESEAHALEVLQQHGTEVKLVAGGQSLVPMMAMRLAKPALLLDINRLAMLKGVEEVSDAIRMRACTRQRDVEHHEELRSRLPLVAQALAWVGHIQTRNRGTIGGSLVHADPSAELPLAAAVLTAKLHLRSTSGQRTLDAGDFFQGPMFTATGDTECLVAIDWPVWKGPRIGSAFQETSIRHGDFAMASAACQLQLDESGMCQRAAFGYGGVDGTPLAFPELASQLVGHRVTPQAAREIARSASTRCEPGDDIHATAAFRRHLAAVLGERVLLKAAEHARGASH